MPGTGNFTVPGTGNITKEATTSTAPNSTQSSFPKTSSLSSVNFQLNNSSPATENLVHQRFIVSIQANFEMENGDVRNILKISVKDLETGAEEMSFIINIKDFTKNISTTGKNWI